MLDLGLACIVLFAVSAVYAVGFALRVDHECARHLQHTHAALYLALMDPVVDMAHRARFAWCAVGVLQSLFASFVTDLAVGLLATYVGTLLCRRADRLGAWASAALFRPRAPTNPPGHPRPLPEVAASSRLASLRPLPHRRPRSFSLPPPQPPPSSSSSPTPTGSWQNPRWVEAAVSGTPLAPFAPRLFQHHRRPPPLSPTAAAAPAPASATPPGAPAPTAR